jgi:RNA polymerase sigma-70 factor (ECF subfamily)
MWKRGPASADQARATRFEQLVLPHLDAAYNLARWLTRDEHNAQDVVQEAYLRAYKFFASFRGDDARAWLLTIVRNTYYTWLKQGQAATLHASFEETLHSREDDRSDSSGPPGAESPEQILLQQDARQLINQALEALPVEFREVVILRELEELSYKEIARMVDIPLGTVMSRLARGRQLLQQALKTPGVG